MSRAGSLRTAVLIFLGVFAAHAAADDALWRMLASEPSLVVLMRHTQSTGGHPLAWDAAGNCVGESVLTAEGMAHARAIGQAFEAHGVKPTVVSSPMCRCRDTARIAFGSAGATDPALREIASADAERANAFERKARALLATPRASSPVVFVSHRPNIDLLSFELIDEGELLVARVNGKGELDVLGRIDMRR